MESPSVTTVAGWPSASRSTSSMKNREVEVFGDGMELCGKVGDGVNQAADLISVTASIPSLNFIRRATFGNWFSPCTRRQVLDAAITSLNTMRIEVSCDRAPFMRTLRCLTVANPLSIGFE